MLRIAKRLLAGYRQTIKWENPAEIPNMRIIPSSILLLLPLAVPAVSQAQVNATITGQYTGGGLYTYMISVDNMTSETFDVFWFSYFPGNGGPVDFLPSQPLNITTQAGWEGSDISYSGGYGIYFEPINDSATPLVPNSTVTFGFESADSPSVLEGYAPLPAGGPPQETVTSFALTYTELYDPNGYVVPQVIVVPEPSSALVLMLAGGVAMWRRRRSK